MDLLLTFLALAALLVPLLLLWLFIRRDQARIENSSTEPVSREQMYKGFTPGRSTAWMGLAGAALLALIGAVQQFLDPTLAPFTGRWSIFHSVLHAVLGTYGLAFFWAACASVFALAAYGQYRAARP